MIFRSSTLLILAVIVLGVRALSQVEKDNQPEQTSFSAEDVSVTKPVEIPADVRKILVNEESVREALRFEGIAPERLPGSWFSASKIHLGDAREEDLVLVGRGPMLGANITWFCVFRPSANGHELFFDGRAHDLIVTNTVSNGYREIQMLSATGASIHTVLFRFDGKRYRVYRDRWEPTQ